MVICPFQVGFVDTGAAKPHWQ